MPDLPTLLNLTLFFLGGLLTGKLLAGPVMSIIHRASFTRENYRGQHIPVGIGVTLLLSSLAVLSLIFFALDNDLKFKALIYLLALSTFTFLGLVDDFWGDRTSSGLRGHLFLLFRGQVTTGALKAIFGLLVAILLAQTAGPMNMAILNAAILALSVNTVNLLDLRPGRAAKAFLALSAILVIFFRGSDELALLLLAMGSLAAILPLDIKARAMLGDAGANALGAVLGLFALWLLGPAAKLVLLFLLASLHLYAENYSLTAAINKYRLLNYLDRLGRG